MRWEISSYKTEMGKAQKFFSLLFFNFSSKWIIFLLYPSSRFFFLAFIVVTSALSRLWRMRLRLGLIRHVRGLCSEGNFSLSNWAKRLNEGFCLAEGLFSTRGLINKINFDESEITICWFLMNNTFMVSMHKTNKVFKLEKNFSFWKRLCFYSLRNQILYTSRPHPTRPAASFHHQNCHEPLQQRWHSRKSLWNKGISSEAQSFHESALSHSFKSDEAKVPKPIAPTPSTRRFLSHFSWKVNKTETAAKTRGYQI